MAVTINQQMSIPIVDFSAWSSGSVRQRQEIAQDLATACQSLGFVYIVGHGVSPELVHEAFDWSKKLYGLSHEDKMKAPHPPGPTPHRGYSHPGLEKVYSKQDAQGNAVEESQGRSLRQVTDFKESYEIGSEENPAQPNVWLPEELLPGFRAFMTTFYWELNDLASLILEAFSQGLNLTHSDRELFLGLHSGHNNQLRLLHYPPVPADKLEKQIIARMPAHTDWSSFTMLFQDDCGGLQLENPNKEGHFIPATPLPGALVLNIGDMLQRLSNDTFPSGTHRVTLPPLQEEKDGSRQITRARYSIPYFVAPDETAIIECLPSRVDEKHPAQYPPVMYREYGGMRSKYSYQQVPTNTAAE
ncbi:MAG: hypothetical protein FRX48_04775 [Lasallia pustulata]|uniref:Fe2OG dioxygenase domain-containing protein n=1 Tax=Lasallia pustulata TaxID=136370 RepID=A0A5M8PRB2_9LECA|nr:MAG: hypothetical protein FRX48_04775 [Lasallia pustulata]